MGISHDAASIQAVARTQVVQAKDYPVSTETVKGKKTRGAAEGCALVRVLPNVDAIGDDWRPFDKVIPGARSTAAGIGRTRATAKREVSSIASMGD